MSLITLTQPNASVAEAYRTLRANLQFAALARPLKSILIASPDSADAAAKAAANLAVVCAQVDKRIILVDANLRAPVLHTLLGVQNISGLIEAVQGGASNLQATSVSGLRLLSAGSASAIASDALSSARLPQLLQTLAAQADLVLISTASTALHTDAMLLAALTDAALLIVTANKTRREDVQQAKLGLEKAHAHLLGAVLVQG